jgi:heme exporter protein A
MPKPGGGGERPKVAAQVQPRVILKTEELAKRLGLRWVLRSVTLEVESGHIAVVVGPNGTGKSTLLKVAAGVWTPTRGRVERFGEASWNDAVSRRVGYLGHRSFLYGALTGQENLEFYGRLYGLERPREQALRALEEVGLRRFAGEPVGRYSRGMLQRAAVARAFLHRPDLVLLDEPYTSLDVDGAALLDGLLRRTVARGGAVLLITHNWEEARRLADWVGVLWQGGLIWQGPVDAETLDRLERQYRHRFGREQHGA